MNDDEIAASRASYEEALAAFRVVEAAVGLTLLFMFCAVAWCLSS